MRTGLVLTLLLSACAGGDDGPAASTIAGSAVVEHVVDGDTIDVAIDGREERIRLLGIDTPETAVEAGGPECFGPEATAATEALLPVGTPVRLERDVVARDDYGRLLAYVYRRSDGLLINEELLRQGFAVPLSIEPNGILRGRLVEAADAAERDDRGLWAACSGG